MLVLLWGLEADTPVATVRDELQSRGVPTIFVDQRAISRIDLRFTVAASVRGSIRVEGQWIDLDDVTAAYLRPYTFSRLPAIAAAGPQSDAWRHAERVNEALLGWTDTTSALLVNPFDAMEGNCSKPFQLEQIRRLGWSVPETLITTDPEAASDFWREHGDVVYKSVSSIRSRVSRLTAEHLERFRHIASCPTQFQRYVAGVDHRVHVVGEELFACRLDCDHDDYRYAGENGLRVEACTLPPDVEARCRRTSRALGLPLAGIDLRRTPRGEWFCFEVNPSPAFTFYASRTGQPICAALARLLMGAGRGEPSLAPEASVHA